MRISLLLRHQMIECVSWLLSLDGVKLRIFWTWDSLEKAFSNSSLMEVIY
jgi:hypothetical protein